MRPLTMSSEADATKGDRVQKFRFTLNGHVDEQLDMEQLAGDLLTALLDREAKGEIHASSVTGRMDERRLQIQIEFECQGFNAAHIAGLNITSDAVTAAGAILHLGEGAKAVTNEHPDDNFATKVEELSPPRPGVTARQATTEMVPA
jgi:hydroxypyruvate isomerase